MTEQDNTKTPRIPKLIAEMADVLPRYMDVILPDDEHSRVVLFEVWDIHHDFKTVAVFDNREEARTLADRLNRGEA